ncbi:hypothetical protein T08_13188 [Trichinella sp. T8]|nr:hypothetical protein T08_13188 [Trichinella sp. T8]
MTALLSSLISLIQWISLLRKEVISEHSQQVCQDRYPQTFCHISSRSAFYCATFQHSNRKASLVTVGCVACLCLPVEDGLQHLHLILSHSRTRHCDASSTEAICTGGVS